MSDDFRQMASDLEKIPGELAGEAESKLGEIVSESFQTEKYQGNVASKKWDGRKKPDKGDKTARNERRSLLVKDGDLVGSFETFRLDTSAGVRTDVPYAPVHNEGLQAGRGKGFKMPQRKFMPEPGEESPELSQHLEKVADEKMNKILK